MSIGFCAQNSRQRLLWRRLTPSSSMCLLHDSAFFSRCQLRLCANVAGTAATPGKVRVHATSAEGKTVSFTAPTGITLMEAIRDLGRLDIEAACDGTCACSTCHVILREEDFEKLSEPSEDEVDMLDLAPSVTKTSRLSCQIQLTDALDGITVKLPPETSNQMS
ncbi:putative adrenodoxin precursor [Trypanosoma cruzi]|uniref:Adrenodoxin, putative n=2 Tax=Trypanosoma cruzi TaxID=5693 RepID=Q4CKU4_TRYCC|nr:adrenodoxin precursor, putative [Trypanosoma cruzi]EAN80895.1 adrenodoxin precursor, putative [Trypanosoma cruzi]PWV01698.1 putative adrenodoxin precursor [Trypanosoma cruzi]|eukprot:XP_802341.1 adrenodoxin precursor [Trypanosoma cruzi strain CL Brener]